jgi:SAM-dependent methyltransferase
MDLQALSERDRIEVERSASEARGTVLAPVDIDRYLDPPADTPYGLEYAFHVLGDVVGKTVLDLGCGSGENLVPLAKRGARVVGIDISPDLIDLSRQRLVSYGLEASLRVGSAYATGLAAGSVDVVFSMALLHHLDLPSARAEVDRILRPGGLFIIREPVRFSRTANLVRRLFPAPKADISDYEHPMTRSELAIVTQGFTIEAARSFRLPLVPLVTKLKVSSRQTWRLDRWLLNNFTALQHFATIKVMSLRK